MRKTLFFCTAHFRQRRAVNLEDRVVPETTTPLALFGDSSSKHSLDHYLTVSIDVSHGGPELSLAVRPSREFGEHLGDIVLVRRLWSGVPGRVYAWSAIEGFNEESGVIAYRGKTCGGKYGRRLEHRIAGERIGVLDHIVPNEIGDQFTNHSVEEFGDLHDLVGVLGGDDGPGNHNPRSSF